MNYFLELIDRCLGFQKREKEKHDAEAEATEHCAAQNVTYIRDLNERLKKIDADLAKMEK